MRTKQLALVGLLIIALILMITPVMGANPQASVAGNPPTSVDLSANRSTVYFKLNTASETNTTLGLFAVTNTPFYVTVSDYGNKQGLMTNYTDSYQAGGLKTQLSDYFGVAGITNTTASVVGTAQGTSSAITDTPVTILAASTETGAKGTPLEMTLSQTNGQYGTHLPTGSVYRIDLQFVITATPI